MVIIVALVIGVGFAATYFAYKAKKDKKGKK
jgi:hypothetical protein